MFLETAQQLDHVMATDQHFKQLVLISLEPAFSNKIAWQKRECLHMDICKILSEEKSNSMGLTLQPAG